MAYHTINANPLSDIRDEDCIRSLETLSDIDSLIICQTNGAIEHLCTNIVAEYELIDGDRRTIFSATQDGCCMDFDIIFQKDGLPIFVLKEERYILSPPRIMVEFPSGHHIGDIQPKPCSFFRVIFLRNEIGENIFEVRSNVCNLLPVHKVIRCSNDQRIATITRGFCYEHSVTFCADLSYKERVLIIAAAFHKNITGRPRSWSRKKNYIFIFLSLILFFMVVGFGIRQNYTDLFPNFN